MTWEPEKVPDVPVYAGDSTRFVRARFLTGGAWRNLVAEGWTDWAAMWRPSLSSPRAIALTVELGEAHIGWIEVWATPTDTRKMQELRPRDARGVWDLQANLGMGVETFLYGDTTHRGDVTR